MLSSGTSSWATRRLEIGTEITIDVAKGTYSVKAGGFTRVYVVNYYIAHRLIETVCFDQTADFDIEDAVLAEHLLGCLTATQKFVETLLGLGVDRGKQQMVDALRAVFHGDV
jgi:hypothetical protein